MTSITPPSDPAALDDSNGIEDVVALDEPTAGEHGVSSAFTWEQDYDDKIENAAADNLIQDWDWKVMRDAIKQRIHQTFAMYLKEQGPKPRMSMSNGIAPRASLVDPTRTPTSSQRQSRRLPAGVSPSAIERRPVTPQGLILPPFPPRPPDERVMPTRLTASEANEIMGRIFATMDDFDEHPPFTIQRVCQLITEQPRTYKFLGKFARALERSLLVSSTWFEYTSDTYAADTAKSPLSPAGYSEIVLRASRTPIFSPIPFLHPDMDPVTGQPITNANGSPSPLTLTGRRTGQDASPSPLIIDDGEIPPPSPRLGLVDELDDPSADSNHMADHPQTLNSKMHVGPPVSRVVDEDDMELDDAELFGPTSNMFRDEVPRMGGGDGSSSSQSDLGFGGLRRANGIGSKIGAGNLNDRFVRSTTPEPETARAMRDATESVRPAGGLSLRKEAGDDDERKENAAEDGEVEDMILDDDLPREEPVVSEKPQVRAGMRTRRLGRRDSLGSSK
ncbi:hypothetical protein FRB93_011750 [Tulasnella sp. JGI-2019a]|nr:hypothetical protein FRB93_011750 [Tulasnella sp. JGI-2019a]